MVSEISIFTLAMENLQFSCDQCNKTNSSEKGLIQHMWMKQYHSKDFRHNHLDYCRQVYKKKYLKDKLKCEEFNMKWNMENVQMGHIIHSNIWNENSKYHTITDHTKRYMKIHAIRDISLFFECQKIHLQERH